MRTRTQGMIFFFRQMLERMTMASALTTASKKTGRWRLAGLWNRTDRAPGWSKNEDAYQCAEGESSADCVE